VSFADVVVDLCDPEQRLTQKRVDGRNGRRAKPKRLNQELGDAHGAHQAAELFSLDSVEKRIARRDQPHVRAALDPVDDRRGVGDERTCSGCFDRVYEVLRSPHRPRISSSQASGSAPQTPRSGFSASSYCLRSPPSAAPLSPSR
jgi:hypothetical protein